jgi:NTP pyrophosphatase (non-canonical NTP hydrolase)
MSEERREIALADVKRLLDEFAASRADKSRKDAESEYGDLLLYLILLAAKSGVDLVAGANLELDRRARDTQLPADRRL